MRHGWNGTCLKDSLMFSYENVKPLNYVISECAIDQLIHNLFDEKKNLKNKFKCLVTENNSNKHKNLKNYLQKEKNEPPGLFYSYSDQCRLATFNEYKFAYKFVSCSSQGLKCFNLDSNETEIIQVLDGTVCDKNKICRFSECVYDTTIRSNKYRYLSKSASVLKETCPQGSDFANCSYIINKYDTSYCDRKVFEDLKSVKYIHSNGTRIFEDKSNFSYEPFCCQACKKAKLKNKTCENLKKNLCYNGGKCVTNKKSISNKSLQILFSCECTKGYTGQLCLNFKPCDFEPCRLENEICYEYGELGNYYCLNEKMNYSFDFKLKDIYFVINTDKKLKYVLRYYLNIIVIMLFFVSLTLILLNKVKLLL